MAVETVNIEDIIVDTEIYPRVQNVWMKAYEYAQAMKAGNKFPPIKLGTYRKLLYLIDGLHRINANKLNKSTQLEAEIKAYTNKRDMLMDAIKYNKHGKPLTILDKTELFLKLRKYKVSDNEISKLLGTPKSNFNVYLTRIVQMGSLEKPVKEVISNAVRKGLITKKEAVEISDLESQNKLVSHDIQHALKQMLSLLHNNLIDFGNEAYREMCAEIVALLNAKL